MDRLIAHTRKLNHDQLEWQTLQEHSCNVAKLCSEICEPFGFPFSVVVLGKFRRFLLVIFLSLFLHLDFSFIYSKFSMPFWGFFY